MSVKARKSSFCARFSAFAPMYFRRKNHESPIAARITSSFQSFINVRRRFSSVKVLHAATVFIHHFIDRPSFLSAFRSEEHTSELQSLTNLVCRLLLEKKKIGLNDCLNVMSPHDHSAVRTRD